MAWTSPRTWVAGEVVTAALLNTHLRDQLLELAGTVGPTWQAYTPTVGNVTLGTGGTITGRYVQIGKTVHFRAKAVLGTGFTIGGGGTAVSLPVAINTTVGLDSLVVGTFNDAGTGTYTAGANYNTGNNALLYVLGANSVWGLASATNPFTWAAGDSFNWAGTYEAA